MKVNNYHPFLKKIMLVPLFFLWNTLYISHIFVETNFREWHYENFSIYACIKVNINGRSIKTNLQLSSIHLII